MIKVLSGLFLLIGFSLSALASPIIIGKDQAPINAHDYKILEEVALNAKIPIDNFRHLIRSHHFIVGPEGFLYRDRKQNGVIDGEDVAVFVSIVRANNSYITDERGSVIGVSIDESEFSDITI